MSGSDSDDDIIDSSVCTPPTRNNVFDSDSDVSDASSSSLGGSEESEENSEKKPSQLVKKYVLDSDSDDQELGNPEPKDNKQRDNLRDDIFFNNSSVESSQNIISEDDDDDQSGPSEVLEDVVTEGKLEKEAKEPENSRKFVPSRISSHVNTISDASFTCSVSSIEEEEVFEIESDSKKKEDVEAATSSRPTETLRAAKQTLSSRVQESQHLDSSSLEMDLVRNNQNTSIISIQNSPQGTPTKADAREFPSSSKASSSKPIVSLEDLVSSKLDQYNTAKPSSSATASNQVSDVVDLTQNDETEPKRENSKYPQWGRLPTADTSISGFGKKAMETHLTQQYLTMDALKKLHKDLQTCPAENTEAEKPKYLKTTMMKHQKQALAWLSWREKGEPAGGILADDMGLGKTLTMISLILKDMEENGSDDEDDDDDNNGNWYSSKKKKKPVRGGTLVICPASVLGQWDAEVKKHVRRRALSVLLYHGPSRGVSAREIAGHDMVVTTYNIAGRECGTENSGSPLLQVKWTRVILDEAHLVRNHKSLMAVGVCEINARYRWCLTGTPVQNKEMDVYALLKFLRCSPFDDLTVWKRWVDNKNAAGTQRLSTIMKTLLLRRTKAELQELGELSDLPSKTYKTIDVYLSEAEMELYEKVATFSRTVFAEFLGQRAERQQDLDAKYGMCNLPSWQQTGRDENQFRTTDELAVMHRRMIGLREVKAHEILVLLLRLRQVCCHPGLIKSMMEKNDFYETPNEHPETATHDSSLEEDVFNQMGKMTLNDNEEGRKVFSPDNPIMDLSKASAKIEAALEILEDIPAGDRAVVVSQWTSFLNIFSHFLKKKNIRFLTLTGEIPVQTRHSIMYDFNDYSTDFKVLLLSLTAGGVGLNLIGGNHLLLLDIHWNPQLEAQACDRIYRVGQRKEVFIYKFLTDGTIEQKIKVLQDKKMALANAVLSGNTKELSKLSFDDLKILFDNNMKK